MFTGWQHVHSLYRVFLKIFWITVTNGVLVRFVRLKT